MFEHALKQEDLHFSSFDNWQLRLTNIVFCFCFSFVFLFFFFKWNDVDMDDKLFNFKNFI